MKLRLTLFTLLTGTFFFSQEIVIQTRNDASIATGGTNSGFFQTSTPSNFPTNAADWWYLLDTRHGNPQYGMQFSGSFFDQNLWFRKITLEKPYQGWSKVLMEDSNGRVGIGGTSVYDKVYIAGDHAMSSILLHANNGSNAPGYLSLWASEPGTSYTGTGIGNNVRNHLSSQPFSRISNTQGGSYMRLLDNGIQFNVISDGGINKNIFNINPNGSSIQGEVVAQNGSIISTKAVNEGGAISLINTLKTGGQFSNWTIFNMTGPYTNSLQFWNYSDDGTQMKSRLKISDEGHMALFGKFEAKEVKVTQSPTADFVFEKDYALPKLEEVEKFIKENKHLPEIASAKVMEREGVNVGEFQIKLLQKIEELTLYSIEQNKKIEFLEQENMVIKSLLERVEKLENTTKSK